jgi:endonuclease/exonuclease/phosphatase family metal-dependent hydrolase
MRADEHTGHYDVDRAKRIAAEVVHDVLTLDELKRDASEALHGARLLARNSTKLQDKRTWLECIKTGQEIIYGKNPDMVFLGDFSKITDVDIANMSQEELMQLANSSKQKRE